MNARIAEREQDVHAPELSLYLRMGEVMRLTGMTHAMIYDGVRAKTFPKWADLPAIWRGRVKIQVSDVHRTVVDLLNCPADGGGIRHVADCLRAYFARPDCDTGTLLRYADRLGNGAVINGWAFSRRR